MTSETKSAIVNRVVLLTDEYDEELIAQLVEDAEQYALAYTNRTVVPDGALTVIGDLAIWAFNRLGTEGDKGRSEGGESYTFDDAPKRIFDVLKRYRLARCGGNAHEAKQDS